MLKHGIFAGLFFLIASAGHGQELRAVRMMTADDVNVSAAFFPVSGESVPAVLLIHTLGQNRDEWTTFAAVLQRNGIAALALDLRGHGESTRRITVQGPQAIDWRKLTAKDFTDMMLDINAGYDWLLKQPGISKRRVAVVGTVFGANLAARYATFNEDVAALLLFSPGINYRGVRTDDVMKKIGPIPLRIVVSRFDSFSYESGKRLIDMRKEQLQPVESREFTVCTGNLNGTAMLKGVGNLPQSILDWLQEKLAPTSMPAGAAAGKAPAVPLETPLPPAGTP